MDFKQLEAYTKVIEMRSFTKAAEALYLSQASVSLYIHALEKELNTQLIIRSTKNIMPTKNGEIFYHYAKSILALKTEATHEINADKDVSKGEIELLASSVPAQHILPEILVHFNRKYPNISFKIKQSDSKAVTEAVMNQKYEIGIVGAKIATAKCYYEHITSDSLVVIAPPLERYQKKLELNEVPTFFYSEKFIMREEGSGTRSGYEQFMNEQGIALNKVQTIATFSNTQSILQAVSKGLGVSIVSKMATDDYVQNKLVHIVDLPMTMPLRNFYFIFKKNVAPSPRVRFFVDFVIDYFQKTLKMD